jgi:hypothetical protein
VILEKLTEGLSDSVGKSTVLAVGFSSMMAVAPMANAKQTEVDLQSDVQATQMIEHPETTGVYDEMWQKNYNEIKSVFGDQLDLARVQPSDFVDKEKFDNGVDWTKQDMADELKSVYHTMNGEDKLYSGQQRYVDGISEGMVSVSRLNYSHGDFAMYEKHMEDNQFKATCVIASTQPYTSLEQRIQNTVNFPENEDIQAQDISISDYDVESEAVYEFIMNHELAHCIFKDHLLEETHSEEFADTYASLKAIQNGDIEVVELLRDVRSVRDKHNRVETPNDHDTAEVKQYVLDHYTQEDLKDMKPVDIMLTTISTMKKFIVKGYDPKTKEEIYDEAKQRLTSGEKREPITQTMVNVLDAQGGQELVERYLGKDGEIMTEPEVAIHYIQNEIAPEVARIGNDPDHLDYYLGRALREQEMISLNPEAQPEIPSEIAQAALTTLIEGRRHTKSMDLDTLSQSITQEAEKGHEMEL